MTQQQSATRPDARAAEQPTRALPACFLCFLLLMQLSKAGLRGAAGGGSLDEPEGPNRTGCMPAFIAQQEKRSPVVLSATSLQVAGWRCHLEQQAGACGPSWWVWVGTGLHARSGVGGAMRAVQKGLAPSPSGLLIMQHDTTYCSPSRHTGGAGAPQWHSSGPR